MVFASSALGPPPLRTLIPQIRVWWRRLQALCSSLPYKYTCCFSDGATEDLLCCCDSIRIHAIPALNFPDVRGGSSTLSVILLISHFHISDILIVSMTILGKVRGDETSGLILLSYSDLSRFVHPLIHLSIWAGRLSSNASSKPGPVLALRTQKGMGPTKGRIDKT